MTRQQKSEAIRALKRCVNTAKSDLMQLEDKLREVSPREADRLSRIIWKLEAWQNR